MMVPISSKNMSLYIEIFNISFKSTQNKQQYGTKITCTEIKDKKNYGELKFDLKMRVWGKPDLYSTPPPPPCSCCWSAL